METDTFQWLLADDYGRGLSGKRRLINVIVDAQYVMEPFVMASLYIDVVHISEAKWREQLRRVPTGHAEHLGRTLCVYGELIHGFAAADFTLTNYVTVFNTAVYAHSSHTHSRSMKR